MSIVRKILMIEGVLLVILFIVLINGASAATFTFVSDTIGTSIPGAPANHTIRFTTTTAIPTNGKITITLPPEMFKIPALLAIMDIDLSINGVEKVLGVLPLPTIVGVGIVSGTQGSIAFTFSSSINAGSQIIVKIGKHANINGSGAERIRNPLYQGSYRITVDSYNAIGVHIDRASAMIATLFPVRVATSLPIAAEKNAAFDPATATTTILTNTNGTLFKVTTPANFVPFSDEVQLNVVSMRKEDIATIAPPPSGKSEIGAGYELTMTRISDDSIVSSFSSNVTFDMFYSDSDISGIDESTLAIRKWNGTTWVAVSGSTLSSGENRVSAQVPSFSMYAIIGDELAYSSSSGSSSGGGAGGGGGSGVWGGSIANVSSSTSTSIGTFRKADVNTDDRVTLADFSIVAYWYKRANPPTRVDINGDGVVNLTDLSIMAFYWKR